MDDRVLRVRLGSAQHRRALAIRGRETDDDDDDACTANGQRAAACRSQWASAKQHRPCNGETRCSSRRQCLAAGSVASCVQMYRVYFYVRIARRVSSQGRWPCLVTILGRAVAHRTPYKRLAWILARPLLFSLLSSPLLSLFILTLPPHL